MEMTSVPIIVVCCYVLGELYKVLFKKKPETYKLIPCLNVLIGGLLGILMYVTDKEMILGVQNAWIAFGIGMVSGASATGANQIIKQLFLKRKENENDNESANV